MTDYEVSQSTKNDSAKKQYVAWVESLSPQDRRRLEEMNLLRFDDPSKPASFVGVDISDVESPLNESQQTQSTPNSEAIQAALRVILSELLTSSNMRLTLDIICASLKIFFEGGSQTEIARTHNVSRAAVSKRIVHFTSVFNLPCSSPIRRSLAIERQKQKKE